jgi:hypothetical protein
LIRAYSQRLLPPYAGIALIAESELARAQTLDGLNWSIQYFSGNEDSLHRHYRTQGYGLDKGYYTVASLKNRELKTFIFPPHVDADQVSESIHELTDFLLTAKLPFPIADLYEYWLLDSTDDSPLALIYSCCEESLMSSFPSKSEWTALPHSKMRIDNTEQEDARNEPPVNYRFQSLIANRAGHNPRAAWFKREQHNHAGFPGMLVREDWAEQAHHDLCQRYLMRKAPRLLMLQSLSAEERSRLEVAARPHVFEVDQFYPLYPEVNDQQLMNTIRVEARLRRATPQTPEKTKKDKDTTIKELDKSMRIIET